MLGEEGRRCAKMVHALFLVISTYSRHIILVRVLHTAFGSPGGMSVGPEAKSQLSKVRRLRSTLDLVLQLSAFPPKSLPGSTLITKALAK